MEYGYDDANQLTSLTYLNGQTTLGDLTYTYDLAGQRVAIGGSWGRTLLPQPVASASYDAGNELTAWGGQPMAYDANGNLTFDGTLVYGWNARNQLATLSSGTTASFHYDATGRRSAKTIDGTTTAFLYDGVDAVQTDVGGNVNVRLLGAAIDEWFASIGPAACRCRWSMRWAAHWRSQTAQACRRRRDTFGAFGATTVSGAASDNAFQFTGRELDASGVYYYRSRYYEPRLARFLSEDPAGLVDGPNTYSYALDNPFGTSTLGGWRAVNAHRRIRTAWSSCSSSLWATSKS